MKNLTIDIPELVRLGAMAKGKVGIEWLNNLESLIAELEHEWDVSVGKVLAGGTDAFVAEAQTSNGERCVLKIAIPKSDSALMELRTLLASKGRGYVQVKQHDTSRGALLLECLGPQLHQLGLSVDRQLEIICSTLKTAWMPLPHGLEIVSGAKKAND